MSTDLVQRTSMDTVIAQLEHPAFLRQIEQSLPEGVSLERFARVTVTAIRSEPSLIAKDQTSLFGAVVRCAQDGLLPDGREAALVAFGNKVAYMPMIGGFRKLAAESGWQIDTQVVYANDEFSFRLGADPHLHHVPSSLDADPGEKIGAYAVATHEDGRKIVEVMRRVDIEKVRNVSKSKSNGPWADWEERMWEKTVGRRIFGKLPLAGRGLERAESVIRAHDDEYEFAAVRPLMSVDEANIAAQLGNVSPPEDAGPVDRAPVVEEPQGGSGDPGTTVVGSGQHLGKTLAEIASEPDGALWMRTRLKTLKADDQLRAPLEAFVEAELPETWLEYRDWLADQERATA